MKNFTTDTKSEDKNFYSKKAIIKAGLRPYSESELSLYMECIVEVLNEKKEGKNGLQGNKEND